MKDEINKLRIDLTNATGDLTTNEVRIVDKFVVRIVKTLETAIAQRNSWIEQANNDQSPLDVEAYIEQEDEKLSAMLKGEDE